MSCGLAKYLNFLYISTKFHKIVDYHHCCSLSFLHVINDDVGGSVENHGPIRVIFLHWKCPTTICAQPPYAIFCCEILIKKTD